MTIVTYGDDRLRQPSKEVEKFDSKLAIFIDDMIETMLKERGVGIAAPQVGKNINVIIVTLGTDSGKGEIKAMINPMIIYESEKMVLGDEGCLSFPGRFEKINRPQKVKVEFQNISGEKEELELTDFDARVVHHEVDHLKGKLFVDYLEDA